MDVPTISRDRRLQSPEWRRSCCSYLLLSLEKKSQSPQMTVEHVLKSEKKRSIGGRREGSEDELGGGVPVQVCSHPILSMNQENSESSWTSPVFSSQVRRWWSYYSLNKPLGCTANPVHRSRLFLSALIFLTRFQVLVQAALKQLHKVKLSPFFLRWWRRNNNLTTATPLPAGKPTEEGRPLVVLSSVIFKSAFNHQSGI